MAALDSFSEFTRNWFNGAFAAPTAAQTGAWEAISQGRHTLVVAPTGSGKTLAAFLYALDRLATAPKAEKKQRCRVLYISPLKALASDVERNLRSPLIGLRREAGRANQPEPDITVSIRSGDTPPNERRRQLSTPPDILITTPESLFLLLTSQARETLRSVETVIIDEIHAVAGSKRGAHLALSLERLDALLTTPAQRIGLSATVQPIDEVALFLGGAAPVTIVEPVSEKQIEINVVVPVKDLTSPIARPIDDPHAEIAGDGEPEAPSIWPHVENAIVELIEQHQSTLVFANSRRLAERLTARINEIYAERDIEQLDTTAIPAEVMGQAGSSLGALPRIARAHHGSVSKEQRALIEDDLKAGRIPAVVATSSLELGIDMGAVDLVIQVESPPSVASGLQRIGRAGHQVGEVSRGIVFPKHRGDLLAATVVTHRMHARDLEATKMPRNPLDVLAQHIVAALAVDDIDAHVLLALVRRAAPYAALPQSAYDAVLDMLAGRYPSDGFAELRPRIVWDRSTNMLRARPGSQRLAVTSGGTIPDRGLFGVFMIGEKASRVGELDEEMVYESRVGDVFALGATSWRIEDITHDRVLVSPAPGQAGRLPFWHGDQVGRPVELGRAIGEQVRTLGSLSAADAVARLRADGLDVWAAENLVRYVAEQREATGQLPDDQTLVVERFRDELGDWRVVLHSPYGAQVHAPWALAISARVRAVTGVDAQVMHSDDGIVLRIPDTDDDAAVTAAIDALFPDPEEVTELVTAALGGSALFASRFRECAARALLLPRRDPGRRTPLWQQRQRSAALLSVASRHPSFPIVIETIRECLQDVYNVPALVELLRDVRSRSIHIAHVSTALPSPFARTLLLRYVAAFLYEGDSPLAERRATALTLDTELLAELLGYVELRELLDMQSMADVEAEVSCTVPQRHARTAEHSADLLRQLGPLTAEDWQLRGVTQQFLAELVQQRRAMAVRIAGLERYAAVEDAAKLRDALGTALPVGLPDAFLEPMPDPLAELVTRYARTHGPFAVSELAQFFGIGPAIAHAALSRLQVDGRVVSGEFRPGGSGTEWCDAEVLRRIRRRSVAALRKEAEPVPQQALGLFLPNWHGIGRPGRGVDAVLRVVEQLGGVAVPASTLETMILPSRVSDYHPAMIDELTSAGEVLWFGRGALAAGDGWVSLIPADSVDLLLPEPRQDYTSGPLAQLILEVVDQGGAWLFREISDRQTAAKDADLVAALWELVWSGQVTADTLAPLRAALAGGGVVKAASAPTRRRAGVGVGSRTRTARLGRANMPTRSGLASASGRWSKVPTANPESTRRAAATSEALLERYGIVTRGSVSAEQLPGGFASAYRVLSVLEDAGRARRGYFVEGLGAAQFATAGAVDQLRLQARTLQERQPGEVPIAFVLAATDPANPYGGALAWPPVSDDENSGHRPGRKAGSAVILVDGSLAAYLERGGRTLLTFSQNDDVIAAAMTALAHAAKLDRLPRLRLERCNGLEISQTAAGRALETVGFSYTPRGMRLRP